MSRSLRRGVLAATAIVFSIASLSACGAGNDAQTLQIRPDNAATTVGDIKIQNATVIAQEKPGAEGPAVVSATLFNAGDKEEKLEAIQLPGSDATVKLTPAGGSGSITVPAFGSVVIGGKGNASAVLDQGVDKAELGSAREVVFQLSETGDVKLDAFVVTAGGYYADFGPTGAPEAPAATPSGSPTASPTGSPTGSPSGSPAGTHGQEGDTPATGGEQSHAAGH
ncbi:DUF461 domain-containing protein [Streptomyces sp. NPDC013953]|uniref:DUF461 domain-containing protein n=1 Tax=Streptomyces sp. NPDC013953 TaxID=3364868 RepID=UPI0036FA18E5